MEQATEKQVKFMQNLNIDIPEGITKQEARLAIDRVLTKDKEDKKPEVEVSKPGEKVEIPGIYQKHATMYTSYTKDIFCEMYGANKDMDARRIMTACIDLVKQAKAAFE